MAFCFSEDFVIGEPLFEIVTLDNNILMRDFSTGVIERREICFDLEVCNENKRIDYDEDIIQQNSLLLRKYPTE
jgi:hypothetical protein